MQTPKKCKRINFLNAYEFYPTKECVDSLPFNIWENDFDDAYCISLTDEDRDLYATMNGHCFIVVDDYGNRFVVSPLMFEQCYELVED